MCPCLHYVLGILWSQTCIDFWTKFTHCSGWPAVGSDLGPALRRHTTMWWFLKTVPDCCHDRTFVSICTHLPRHYWNPLKMFSIKRELSSVLSALSCLSIKGTFKTWICIILQLKMLDNKIKLFRWWDWHTVKWPFFLESSKVLVYEI